jgi:DnaJ-domain-containing protein 1
MARTDSEALDRPFQRTRRFFRQEAAQKTCDRPGCEATGSYRAPRSRDRLDEYYYFCLEHVREYNRAWNYYAGMSEAQIEQERRRDSCWHRPSWPFGSIGQASWRDDFGFFDEERADAQAGRRQWEQNRQRSWQDAHDGTTGGPGRGRCESAEGFDKALAELGMEAPATFAAVKARYKELVKRFHPDANGGDRTHEDKLKTVNQAYATLRKAFR